MCHTRGDSSTRELSDIKAAAAAPAGSAVFAIPSRDTHKHNVDANNESTTNINNNKVVDVLVVDKYEKTTVSACYSFNKYLCL